VNAAAADIVLPAELRHAQAMTWLNTLRWPNEAADRACVVDAQALRSFDSSALACLLELRRRQAQRGGALRIVGLNERLQRLALVYGLADLL
jgi:phospholipid transport system transporter-binding protein